jgi:hypothetical protein
MNNMYLFSVKDNALGKSMRFNWNNRESYRAAHPRK